MRVKNISLGYTIPETIVHRAHLQKFRVYAAVCRILSWLQSSPEQIRKAPPGSMSRA